MAVLYGVRQIRVQALQEDGSADPSTSPVTSTQIQTINITPAYIDGMESTLRGGDGVTSIIQEDDIFRGVNLSMNLATVEAELKQIMVGGTYTADDQWEAPVNDDEMPYPYHLEVWQQNYTESDSESTADGFIKHDFYFCKRGRLGGKDMDQQAFSVENYTCEARRNESDPSDIQPAWEHDIVASIV